MSEYELALHESKLTMYSEIVKTYRSNIKRMKWFIALYIFNSAAYCWITTSAILSSKPLWTIIFNSFISVVWFSGAILMYYTIKQRKIGLKENKILYDEELKIVDYTKYIKENRLKKLKKLKSNWLS